MNAVLCSWLSAAAGMVAVGGVMSAVSGAESAQAVQDNLRKPMLENFNQGNFKDAYEGYRKLVLDPQTDHRRVCNDLESASQCLEHLNRLDEIDALVEDVVKIHQENWRLLWRAAENYMRIPHHGFIVAGKFYRGNNRGGGRMVNAIQRDRVRALQLMVQAMPLTSKDEYHGEVSDFWLTLANMLLNNRGYNESWRLQYLTDLKVLPDYEDGRGYYRQISGAPVDADGRPVFHRVPKSFEAAETDGQRWRWCLQQAMEFSPQRLNAVRMQFAEFLLNQFGVQTMAQWGWAFGRMESDDTREDESGTYALHTLKENETIARLASGIKRFTLPDEFNYIKIFQEIVAGSSDSRSAVEISRDPSVIAALEHLAQIFENRRQYPIAAEYWRQLVSNFPNQEPNRRQMWQQQLDQIVGNWGHFEPAQTQPAGRGATVEYRFRNGRQIDFTAHEIKVEKLLADVKAFLQSNPPNLDWQKINIGEIGYRLVQENQKQYVGREVARWQMSVEPRQEHFDSRVTVTTPLQRPGAYLVTAKMSGGNTSFIVLWVDDTAIVKKPLAGKTYYFVADAVTGKPTPKANVEFFGWRQLYHDQPPRHDIITANFAEFTDADGQVVPDPRQQAAQMQWLVTARTSEGRFAYLGFTNVWYGNWYDAQYNATKVYAITDRPVYRPEQKVKYKFWIRHAQYDMENTSDFAGQDFTSRYSIPRARRSFRKRGKPTLTAASRANMRFRPTPHWASTG